MKSPWAYVGELLELDKVSDPSEQRAFDGIPDCWPNCTDEELRAFLEAAVARG